MRVIIAGGRDFQPSLSWLAIVSGQLFKLKATEVVSGMAKGADTFGINVAHAAGLSLRMFPAKWAEYGRRAGYLRNVAMADYADALIALPGGKGTAHMLEAAGRYGLEIIDLSGTVVCEIALWAQPRKGTIMDEERTTITEGQDDDPGLPPSTGIPPHDDGDDPGPPSDDDAGIPPHDDAGPPPHSGEGSGSA